MPLPTVGASAPHGRQQPRWLRPGLLLGLIVVLWLALAPQVWGGWMTYVVVQGSSMQPALQPGDMVALRQQSSYGPGDVVAYTSSMADTVVLHRIVAIIDGRVLLKGDANDFIDMDRPATGELLGRQVGTVPGIGRLIGVLGYPWVRLGVVIGAVALVASGVGAGGRGGRAAARAVGGNAMTSGSPWRWWALGAIGSVGVLLALLLVPTTASQTELRSHTVATTFSYEAQVPPSATYVSGVVATGDPIATGLVGSIDVVVQLAADSGDVWSELGEVTLVAEVASTAGWSRQLSTAEVGRVGNVGADGTSSGPIARGVIPVDFSAAREIADGFAATLEVPGQTTVNVAVVAPGLVGSTRLPLPDVDAGATADRAPADGGAPDDGLASAVDGELAELTFNLTGGAAVPQVGEGAGTLGDRLATGPVANADGGLLTEGLVIVPETITQPATVGIGLVTVPVVGLALTAGLAAVVATAMAAASAVSHRNRRRVETDGDVPARLRRQMVDVADLPPGVEASAVDVADLAGLCALAQAANQFVLVRHVGDETTYWVIDGPVAYRHRAYRHQMTPPP